MREAEAKIEKYFKQQVKALGGVSYKWTSPTVRGVADQIAFLPNGIILVVEVKNETGKLRPLQVHFGRTIVKLGTPYFVVNSKKQVDEVLSWIVKNSGMPLSELSKQKALQKLQPCGSIQC